MTAIRPLPSPPPVPESEMETERRDLTDEKLSQRDMLLIVADDACVWRTPEGETFATITVDGHQENHAIRSAAFRDWLICELARRFQIKGRPASAGRNVVADALAAIEARGHLQTERRTANLRVTEHEGAIFIDLGASDWGAARVTPEGWRLVPGAPVPLIRTRKTAPFPMPAGPGDFAPLRRLLGQLSESEFSLFLGWCLSALLPRGPYPILALSGEAGTGKSSLARLARRLTDPTAGDLLQPPGDDRDLIAAARHNRVLTFDNLSSIKADLADSLCRLATGGEIGGRALYSDHDQATFSTSRPILLNGIPDLASRGDLASRAIVLRLGQLDKRATERDFWREVEQVLQITFEAILTALSAGLANFDKVPTPHVRMADFARLVVAAECALPWKPGTFLRALEQNGAEAAAALIESEVVAMAVQRLIANRPQGWDGRMSALLGELNALTDEDVRRSSDWPGNPRWLGERLRRAAPALRGLGVDVQERRTAKGVHVHIGKIDAPATLATLSGGAAAVGNAPSVANVAKSQVWDACGGLEERAAIMEIDGGLPRNEAERLALLESKPG